MSESSLSSWFSDVVSTVTSGIEQATVTVVTTFSQLPDIGEQLSKVDVPQISLPDLTLPEIFPEVKLPDVNLNDVFSDVALPDVSVPNTEEMLESLSKVPMALVQTSDDAIKFFGGVYDSFNTLVAPAPPIEDVYKASEPLVVVPPTPPPVKKENQKVHVKLLMLGDDQTGKSALLQRWVYNKFTGIYNPTTGADFVAKELNVDDIKVTLQIWDTSGQERYHSLGVAFYRGSDAVIIVCDFTRGSTVDHLEKWRDDFIDRGNPKDRLTFPFLVIGNKNDMEPESASLSRRIQSWCSGFNIPCFFTSAKDGTSSIDEVFTLAVKKVLEARQS